MICPKHKSKSCVASFSGISFSHSKRVSPVALDFPLIVKKALVSVFRTRTVLAGHSLEVEVDASIDVPEMEEEPDPVVDEMMEEEPDPTMDEGMMDEENPIEDEGMMEEEADPIVGEDELPGE